MTEIITRQQALENNLKTYFVGKPCPKGHVAPRKVLNSECTQCASEYMKEYLRQYYLKNKGKEKPTSRKRIEREPVKDREKRMAEQKRGYSKVGNGWAIKAIGHKYYRPFMPKWANKVEMKKIYLEARKLREDTGLDYEVDHIIPIRGVNVCGLHVENNLRVVLKDENRSKYNKLLDHFAYN